jgi:hypothetical protein
MRLIACALALSLAGLTAAHAEVLVSTENNIPDNGTLRVELPQGEVGITLNTVEDYGIVLHAGGQYEVLLESAHMPRLLKVHENSALLELSMGGRACPILFAWITYDADGLRASEEFGTCAEQASFAVTEAGPAVSMEEVETRNEVVYVYDAGTGALTETRS